jgi:hypothetical protein
MIVIHFGLRKAGSSSIQSFLKSNENYLRSLGYDYAPVGHSGGRSHLNITYEARRSEYFSPELGSLGDLKRYWRENKAKSLLISSEILEGTAQDGINLINRKLSKSDDEFRLLMIVRDLVSLITSSYSQHSKVRGSDDFDKFFRRFVKLSRADFFNTAARWAKTFGWDQLRVRPLDKAFLLNGDLIDDFMATTGIEITADEKERLKRKQEANVSPGWRVTEALRALYDGRHGLPDNHPLLTAYLDEGAKNLLMWVKAEQIGDQLNWNVDKGRYLTRSQAQTCLDMYRRSLDSLNSHLSEPVPQPNTLEERGFVPRDVLPDVSLIPTSDLRRFYDELGDAA